MKNHPYKQKISLFQDLREIGKKWKNAAGPDLGRFPDFGQKSDFYETLYIALIFHAEFISN